MNARRRRVMSLAALAGWPLWPFLSAAQPASPAPPAASDACALCREQLQTVQALRARLPAGWDAQLQPEPVLGGQMLVVRAGARDAPPLLLVHGLSQNGFTDWMPVIGPLSRDWRVIAVDLPGFGYSTVPQARLSPTNDARVLQRLLASLGVAALPVVGHSMGAAVALRLAADFPAQVSKLVLVDLAGLLHRTAFTKHATIGQLPSESWPDPLREPVERLLDLGRIIVERALGLPDPTAVLRSNEWLWPLVLQDRSSINAALALMDEDFSAALYTLRQPVQVIWGEADAVAPLRTGVLLARRLPQAQLHVLRGVGHTPMLQAGAEFTPLLQRVLRQEPLPRAPVPPLDGALQDLVSRDERDRHIGGRYRTVRIERGIAVHLKDLVAERIEVRDSIVRMTGVVVRGDELALDVVNSELVATACDFEARQGVRADNARLDLAGVRLHAQGFAIQALRRSRVVASVCELRDLNYRGWWHDDRELQGELLNLSAAKPSEPTSPTRSQSGS